jgi:hypothetical protein
MKITVIVALLLGALMLPAGTAQARTSYHVDAQVAKNVILGKKAVVRGAVSPRAGNKMVILQKRYTKRGPWQNVKTATTTANGIFQFKDRVTTLKPRWYRVVKPGSKRIGAGSSAPLKVRVFKWHYLSQMEWLEDGDWDTYSSIRMNGRSYARSVAADNEFYGDLEVDLRRKCIKMQTAIGALDDSASGVEVQVDVYGDDLSKFSRQFSLGEVEQASIRLNGVLRLRVSMAFLSSGRGNLAFPGLGSARLLCRFP